MKSIEEYKAHWDNFNQDLYIEYLIKKQQHEKDN